MRGSRVADLTLAWYGFAAAAFDARARAPFSQTRTLTDAQNFMYYCLPNHRSALAKGVGGDPPFQGDPGLILE